jgi:hypothetical protein
VVLIARQGLEGRNSEGLSVFAPRFRFIEVARINLLPANVFLPFNIDNITDDQL